MKVYIKYLTCTFTESVTYLKPWNWRRSFREKVTKRRMKKRRPKFNTGVLQQLAVARKVIVHQEVTRTPMPRNIFVTKAVQSQCYNHSSFYRLGKLREMK